jgi:uncharacterized integral membrane protein
MRIKTIVIILITVLLTIVIMQNSDQVLFKILFFETRISKLIIMLIIAAVAFILGYLVGRPRRAIRLGGDEDSDDIHPNKPGTLSDDDKEYIN